VAEGERLGKVISVTTQQSRRYETRVQTYELSRLGCRPQTTKSTCVCFRRFAAPRSVAGITPFGSNAQYVDRIPRGSCMSSYRQPLENGATSRWWRGNKGRCCVLRRRIGLGRPRGSPAST